MSHKVRPFELHHKKNDFMQGLVLQGPSSLRVVHWLESIILLVSLIKFVQAYIFAT